MHQSDLETRLQSSTQLVSRRAKHKRRNATCIFEDRQVVDNIYIHKVDKWLRTILETAGLFVVQDVKVDARGKFRFEICELQFRK